MIRLDDELLRQGGKVYIVKAVIYAEQRDDVLFAEALRQKLLHRILVGKSGIQRVMVVYLQPAELFRKFLRIFQIKLFAHKPAVFCGDKLFVAYMIQQPGCRGVEEQIISDLMEKIHMHSPAKILF